jgi:hypothetical protein
MSMKKTLAFGLIATGAALLAVMAALLGGDYLEARANPPAIPVPPMATVHEGGNQPVIPVPRANSVIYRR